MTNDQFQEVINRLDAMDGRLRGVETDVAYIKGKLDATTDHKKDTVAYIGIAIAVVAVILKFVPL